MQLTDQQLRTALKQHLIGYEHLYTIEEVINWMCTHYDVTLLHSARLVAEVCAPNLKLHK
jgi:hypothetical protein